MLGNLSGEIKVTVENEEATLPLKTGLTKVLIAVVACVFLTCFLALITFGGNLVGFIAHFVLSVLFVGMGLFFGKDYVLSFLFGDQISFPKKQTPNNTPAAPAESAKEQTAEQTE